jgi:hypothetical protein
VGNIDESSGDVGAFNELFGMLERIFHRPVNSEEMLK